MKQIGLILKVNLLSLLALPLLILSGIFNLAQKALEKAIVFVGVGVALLALLALNALFNNPNGFLEGIGYIFAFLVIGGSIILLVLAVLVLCGSIAATVLTVIVSVAMAILNMGGELFRSGYLYLYDICYEDMEQLKSSDAPNSRFGCIFWYLLYGLHQAFVFLFSMMFPLSLIASVGFVGYSIYSVYHAVHSTFGIGIFSYLKLFPVTNVVFTVLDFALIVTSVVVVLISLGIEWSEWGESLKFASQSADSNWNSFVIQYGSSDFADDTSFVFSAGQSQQRCQQYMEVLNDLFDNCESVYEQVSTATQQEQDSNLQYLFSEYLETLQLIHDQIPSAPGTIQCSTFEQKIIPLIQTAQRKEKEIQKDVLRILKKHSTAAQKNNTEIDFFSGCTTQDELQSRYHALCKIYHPDVGGHTETFQQIQAQYEQKRTAMNIANSNSKTV